MVRKIRSKATGVVTRKLAGDLIVTNLFGKDVPNIVICACGIPRYKSEFYLESYGKRKHAWQVRLQCVDCWDNLNGKKHVEEYEPTNTLDDFLKNPEKVNA